MISDLWKQFDWSALAFFVLFALPGFISLKVWTQIVPSPERPLKDVIGEVLAFGILNAAVIAPLLWVWRPDSYCAIYIALVFGLVMLPAIWPFLLKWVVDVLQKFDILLIPDRSSWDHAFLRRQSYFVIVHLADGRRIGGYFGENSYAGVYPNSGHLYLEEVWSLSADGEFQQPVPDTAGIILEPDDYAFIELKTAQEENGDG